jgi:hypothetical protein
MPVDGMTRARRSLMLTSIGHEQLEGVRGGRTVATGSRSSGDTHTMVMQMMMQVTAMIRELGAHANDQLSKWLPMMLAFSKGDRKGMLEAMTSSPAKPEDKKDDKKKS